MKANLRNKNTNNMRKGASRMKEWNENTIGTVYPILERVIYNIMINRVLVPRIKERGVFNPYEIEFWTHISNNAIQMAALDWCKVFGYEDSMIFYAKFVDIECFKRRIDSIDFQSIQKEIQNFVNKYVVNYGLYDVPIPAFDDAIKVISAFVEQVEAEYDMYGDTLGSIEGLCKAYQMQIVDYLEQHKIDVGT